MAIEPIKQILFGTKRLGPTTGNRGAALQIRRDHFLEVVLGVEPGRTDMGQNQIHEDPAGKRG